MHNLTVMNNGMQWRITLMQARPAYGGGYPNGAVSYIEGHNIDNVKYLISGFVDKNGSLFQARTGGATEAVRQALIKGGA